MKPNVTPARERLSMDTVVMVGSMFLGRGDDGLGSNLMANFLRKLWASPDKPGTIVFYNAAVNLLVAGADGIEAVSGLSDAGVDIVACGTCVSFHGIAGRLAAGRVSDMQEIVSLLLQASKTVTV